jgi:electron transfer flavoprotein alpha subunit
VTRLVVVEHGGGQPDELSLQALAVADDVQALLVGPGAREAAARLPVAVAHVAEDERLDAYAPGAWARCVTELVERTQPDAVLAAGSESGNEVLAHVAARLDLPFAANCISVDGDRVTRMRWGGSLLEEAVIHGSPALLTVAPHAVPAAALDGAPEIQPFAPALTEADLLVRVSEHADTVRAGVSLADAKVVVSGGRGVGSAEGFGILEELAGMLDAAVGCSRVVTSAGWRPHTDQVGQTGTKVSPDLYIACGISGATQHIAGCRGAKKILAINSDVEAPILNSADYAVIGDLTEIVPAITAELRKSRAS